LHSAPRALRDQLLKYPWPIAALIVALSLAGCLNGDRVTATGAVGAVQSYRGVETPGTLSRLEAAAIRYAQSTYSLYGEVDDVDLYKVEDNIQWLRDHPDQELPWGGPIRVFRKQAFMNDWGPVVSDTFYNKISWLGLPWGVSCVVDGVRS
jgi:hypothetical protein